MHLAKEMSRASSWTLTCHGVPKWHPGRMYESRIELDHGDGLMWKDYQMALLDPSSRICREIRSSFHPALAARIRRAGLGLTSIRKTRKSAMASKSTRPTGTVNVIDLVRDIEDLRLSSQAKVRRTRTRATGEGATRTSTAVDVTSLVRRISDLRLSLRSTVTGDRQEEDDKTR